MQFYELDAQDLFSATVHTSAIRSTRSANVKQLACKMEGCFNFSFESPKLSVTVSIIHPLSYGFITWLLQLVAEVTLDTLASDTPRKP